MDLRLDPPAVVVQQCHLVVQRWRWKRIEKQFLHLAATGTGRGPLMEPVWKILQPRARNADWTPQHQGGLRSAIVGRQYPQVRMRAVGWAEHDRCLVCLNGIVEREAGPTAVRCPLPPEQPTGVARCARARTHTCARTQHARNTTGQHRVGPARLHASPRTTCRLSCTAGGPQPLAGGVARPGHLEHHKP